MTAGPIATCTSPKQFTALAEGSHTVSVRAVDNAGNTGAADSKTFSVDTTAPSTSISNVQVTGSTATARVFFSSPASDVARFECRVDAGAFATCTSPKQYTGLAGGAHTAYVRAVDNAGNIGVADSRAFTVDTTAPTTSIGDVQVSGPTATVSFSSPASDVARFECRVDGDAYATCTSPKQFTALAEGAHTAYVRAVDNDGNIGAADSKTFTVDTTAPSTSISDVQVSGTAATVSFSSPASDMARFECRVDGDAYATCTSPTQLTGLVAGAHTISVRSVDHAGNTGTADTRAFTVDAAPIDAGTVAAPEPSGAGSAAASTRQDGAQGERRRAVVAGLQDGYRQLPGRLPQGRDELQGHRATQARLERRRAQDRDGQGRQDGDGGAAAHEGGPPAADHAQHPEGLHRGHRE